MMDENIEKLKALTRRLWETKVDFAVQPLQVLTNLFTWETSKQETARVERRVETLHTYMSKLTELGFDDLKNCVRKAALSYDTVLEGLAQQTQDLKAQAKEAQLKLPLILADPSYYYAKSRESLKRTVDAFLEPHKELIAGGKNTVSTILDDASSRGVQYVTIWSMLSEYGFISIGFLGAGFRLRAYVEIFSAMQSAEFGVLFADSNKEMFSNARETDRVMCTFQSLMDTGKCTRNGAPFNVSKFMMVVQNPHAVTTRTFEFTTSKDLSIQESEGNIYHNLHLTDSDVPTFKEVTRVMGNVRNYLYDHLDSSKMFHFRVYFDGVEQLQYSEPGSGEELSKVLHWKITHKHLYYELIERNFAVTRFDRTARSPTVAINQTAFDEHPRVFLNNYRYMSEESAYTQGSIWSPQRLELRLWSDTKADFLTEVHDRTNVMQPCILC